MKRHIIIAIVAALALALIIPTACAKSEKGTLPNLNIGDKWVYKVMSESTEYTMTLEVTGEDVTDGKDCYMMRGLFEPPALGAISGVSLKLDKATMFTLRMEMLLSTDLIGDLFEMSSSYSYEIPGKPYYPLEMGKECEVIETEIKISYTMGWPQKQTMTDTYTYTVERIAEITVPAGTFRCFKIVKYDKSGNAVSTYWTSDEVKHEVKVIDHVNEETTELVSYSIH